MTIIEIEKLITKNETEKAFKELFLYVKENPDNAKAWYLLGNVYRKHEQWGEAINALNKAKLIDPEGPADAAIESIYNIIRFMNKDLMNP
ncbi:MAG: tetratricopeptide repeat protein [Bacteroidales bacterium]